MGTDSRYNGYVVRGRLGVANDPRLVHQSPAVGDQQEVERIRVTDVEGSTRVG